MYHRPHDLSSALTLAGASERTVVAGGTDIYPALRQGQAPAVMLDVTAIPEFCEITATRAGFRIGAAVTWSAIVAAELPPAFDGLKQAARQVGSVQIQNAGTVAGNICNASPAADGVPPLLALEAQVELASAARGRRCIDLCDFIQGPRQTAIAPDELVTALVVPVPPPGAGSSFQKLGSRAHLVISIVMVAAVMARDARGRISDARIAVGSCAAKAQRLAELEALCIGKLPDAITVPPESLAVLTPIDDVRGSADYRRHAAAELCLRAIREALHHEHA